MDTVDMQNALGAIMGKLEALEQRNAALAERNSALEARVALLDAQRPTSSPIQPAPAITQAAAPRTDSQATRGGATSRRTWLKRAAGAAVASVVAGAMVQRDTDTAAAHHTTNALDVYRLDAHYVMVSAGASEAIYADNNDTYPTVSAHNKGSGPGVNAGSGSGTGVKGRSYAPSGYGVHGEGATGVLGKGKVGVEGVSTEANWSSVWGHHAGPSGYGTVGDGAGAGAGALGRNAGTGPGVQGISTQNAGDGVQGTGKVGVRGKSGIAGSAAIVGEHTGTSSNSGYGGQFKGARAQVRLVPAGTAGKPTSGTHAKGELYMDSAATLWVCTSGSTSSVPAGTWKRVTMA